LIVLVFPHRKIVQRTDYARRLIVEWTSTYARHVIYSTLPNQSYRHWTTFKTVFPKRFRHKSSLTETLQHLKRKPQKFLGTAEVTHGSSKSIGVVLFQDKLMQKVLFMHIRPLCEIWHSALVLYFLHTKGKPRKIRNKWIRGVIPQINTQWQTNRDFWLLLYKYLFYWVKRFCAKWKCFLLMPGEKEGGPG
jgi:hypothetical protein